MSRARGRISSRQAFIRSPNGFRLAGAVAAAFPAPAPAPAPASRNEVEASPELISPLLTLKALSCLPQNGAQRLSELTRTFYVFVDDDGGECFFLGQRLFFQSANAAR